MTKNKEEKLNDVEEYETLTGELVIIKELSDKDLVDGYRFFKKYCDVLEDVLRFNKDISKDGTYANYVSHMVSIKDALKNSVQRRKLRLSDYP